MNERIKQLAVEAYQWALAESKGGSNTCDPGSDYFLALEKRKFAELIVRECMWKIMTRKEEAIDNQWHLDDAMSSVLRDISEHFGVD